MDGGRLDKLVMLVLGCGGDRMVKAGGIGMLDIRRVIVAGVCCACISVV